MLDTCQPKELRLIADQLRTEFGALSSLSVERCVADTFRCARHLGFEVTPELVERVARERLRAMANSEPPSSIGGALHPRANEDPVSAAE